MYNIKSILTGNENKIEVIGQEGMSQTETKDNSNCLITLNPKAPYYRETLEKLSKMNLLENHCIVIDRNVINNDDAMDLLINEAQYKKVVLRIVDKEELTYEEKNKLRCFYLVYSHNRSEQKNFYYIGSYENLIFDESIYIKEDITEEELEQLVNFVNNSTMEEQIYFKFYNISKSIEILKKLKSLKLKNNCKINILGYLLKDKPGAFNDLYLVSNYDISITYTTCYDLISKYEKEPYITGNYYYSELEGGGTTDINNYYKMISILEKEEQHIKYKNYSPLETMIYGYNFLKENYIYDDNHKETDKINPLYNRSLDFVLNRNEMVCEGYATLYSALMRRCGIPNFRYSSYNHVKNIARIKDEKYNIDKIGVFDPTFDACYLNDQGIKENLYSYKHFCIAPKDTTKYKNLDILTIPCTLSMSMEEFLKFDEEYYSNWDKIFIYDYIPLGFTMRMLELMGFNYKELSLSGFYELVNELNNSSIFDELDPIIVFKALYTVLTKEGKIYSKDHSDLIIEECKKSILERKEDYRYPPQIRSEKNLDGKKNEQVKDILLINDCNRYKYEQEYKKINEIDIDLSTPKKNI